jgi:hypothetical protein
MDCKSKKDTMWRKEKELQVEIQTEKVGEKNAEKNKDGLKRQFQFLLWERYHE